MSFHSEIIENERDNVPYTSNNDATKKSFSTLNNHKPKNDIAIEL